MTARLLMIALDAADGGLLEAWASAGVLPHLAALHARGAMKRLTAPFGATDDALWASFQYGLPLGEHGRYHYRIPLGTGKFGMAHVQEGEREPFWRRLARQGLRVAVLDVPKCAAPRPMNGIHLADWLVHGRNFPAPLSHPAELAAAIVERFGAAPPSRCDYHQAKPGDRHHGAVAENLLLSVSRKRAAGRHYQAAEPWDLFLIGFKEAHCAGHGLWDLVDPRHARHDPARDARLGAPVRRVFAALDAAIGDLVAGAGPDAEVVVLSTGDMEPNGTLDHLLPGIVERLNQRLGQRQGGQVAPLVAVLPYNENFGALRLCRTDVRSDPLEEGRRLLEIEALLGDLRDGDSGLPVITAFARPASSCPGARAASLPDLLLRYRANAFPRAVQSAALGRIAADTPRWRPGNHAGGGLVVAAGDRVARSLAGVGALEDFAALATRVLRPEG